MFQFSRKIRICAVSWLGLKHSNLEVRNGVRRNRVLPPEPLRINRACNPEPAALFGGRRISAVALWHPPLHRLSAVNRIRLVNLSITHKFGSIKPKLDVSESGEPTPHDLITWRRVTAAGKIAAQFGQFGDVERQRPF